MNMKTVHMVTFTLLVVGGLNWGLMALLNVNLVNMVVGSMPMVEKVVYVLVGASAVYELVNHAAMCKMCGTKK